MKTITMLEFRRDSQKILRRVRNGERMIMTFRGKPTLRLEPIVAEQPQANDPFYRIADKAISHGASLTNSQIDNIIYGQ